MTKNGHNGKKHRHNQLSILKPSHPDSVQLAFAVEERFVDLCRLYIKVRGCKLVPPLGLDKDLFLWRRFVIRLRSGNISNSQDELDAVRRVAQWTLDVKNELTIQPRRVLEWRN